MPDEQRVANNSQTYVVDADEFAFETLEQNLRIAESREQVKEQQALRRGARAQALPNVGLSGGIARLNPNIATVAGVPIARAWALG